MNSRRIHCSRLLEAAAWLLLLFVAAPSLATAADAIVQLPNAPADHSTWQVPSIDEIKSQLETWLKDRRVDAATADNVRELWTNLPADRGEESILDRLAQSFALADENARKLVDLCAGPRRQLILPPQPWLSDPQTPPLVAHNLRLFYACWLAQQSLLDEAREQVSGLRPADVVAPSALLFYQSVVYHKLLERDRGLKTLDELLQGPEASPRRYRTVAKLMQADLKDLDEDSLEHIARRMDDIRRRLDLGRAGPKVRKEEDGVIESLDKLIKEIEDQQQQQLQQQQQQAANRLQSSKPATESRLAGGKGPGDVEKKNIGSQNGWGDLPPKEREEALQQIGRDLPANYRDVIEQYFKRLAGEESDER